MSERIKMDERVRNLERDITELKAQITLGDNGSMPRPRPSFATPSRRESADAARALREAEREYC